MQWAGSILTKLPDKRGPPFFKVTFVVVVSCHYLLSWKGRDDHQNQSMAIVLHKCGFHTPALCNHQWLFFVDDEGKGKTKGSFNEKSICSDWHWVQIVPPLEIKTEWTMSIVCVTCIVMYICKRNVKVKSSQGKVKYSSFLKLGGTRTKQWT